jgi:hypothetical protein
MNELMHWLVFVATLHPPMYIYEPRSTSSAAQLYIQYGS